LFCENINCFRHSEDADEYAQKIDDLVTSLDSLEIHSVLNPEQLSEQAKELEVVEATLVVLMFFCLLREARVENKFVLIACQRFANSYQLSQSL